VAIGEIASLRRRWVAFLIDGGVIVAPIVVTTGGGVYLYMRYERRRSGSDSVHVPDISPGTGRVSVFRRVGESRKWALVFEAASLPIEIRLRNWRSPGMRALSLRRADARTGGPVTVRSALVRKGVEMAWRELNRRAQRPFDDRFREDRRLIMADLDEIRRRHADDREARERAMTEVFKRHHVTPWASCGRGLLGGVLLQLSALCSERNQTLPDRVAGIVVVRD
jgi:hypothetical protein